MSSNDFVKRVHDEQNKIDIEAGFNPPYDNEGKYTRGNMNEHPEWDEDEEKAFHDRQAERKAFDEMLDATRETIAKAYGVDKDTGMPLPFRKQVVKWADPAMYGATDMVDHGELVKPHVTVVNMTKNPLRVMAAAAQIYRGDVVDDPNDIPRTVAMKWLEDMGKTSLNAPLEYIDIHLYIEGVSRAWMDQLTRQRTAVFSAESLRFAVKENAINEVVMPPEIQALKDDDPKRVIWDNAIARIAWSYKALVDGGIPAEAARGLLPMNIATRIHYKTNLRNLADHAGFRLCSQAQAEWKQVWFEIIRAIIEYGPDVDRWQQRAITSMFKPICFQTDKCEFDSSIDRYCSIRERVKAHSKAGNPSNTWTDINPLEPLHPEAARKPQ